MAVWEQVQSLSDSQFHMMCQKYNIVPQFPAHTNRYWLARRLHVAIVAEQARWRAQQAVYDLRRNDRSVGYPVRTYRRRRHRNMPAYMQRYRGGDELQFDQGQPEQEEDELQDQQPMGQQDGDEEEEEEQTFQYDYEHQQADQAEQAQELMLQVQQQQEQQQQEQKEQMRLLQLQQLYQQRQLQHLEQYLQQLEEERQRMFAFQQVDQRVAAIWSYQQQFGQMQQNQIQPQDFPHATPQVFPQDLAQKFPQDLQPGLEIQNDLSNKELLPQRTKIDLALSESANKDLDEETDYLTASSSLEVPQECDVRIVNYLTSEQLEQIMQEKQALLDNKSCRLTKVFSRTQLLNGLDNTGDTAAAAVCRVPYYRIRQRHRDLWRYILHVFRQRAGNKLIAPHLGYAILCCALAVCTFMGAKLLK